MREGWKDGRTEGRKTIEVAGRLSTVVVVASPFTTNDHPLLLMYMYVDVYICDNIYNIYTYMYIYIMYVQQHTHTHILRYIYIYIYI